MKFIIRKFWVAVLLILLWTFFPATTSFADMNPALLNNSAASVDCNLTPDPEACLRALDQPQTTALNPNSLPLNTQTLGLEGPLSLALKYDADLLWILGIDYVQMLSKDLGVSGKFGIGANERRANITAGYAFSANQMLKVTYEYLAQNLPFDFYSGNINTWVQQNAYGGAYQQILEAGILHSVEISGYTIKANNKQLTPITYQDTDYYVTDYRRIAGGLENTIEAAINLLPFKNTALTLGAGFSEINYDSLYEVIQGRKILAYKAELTHLLTSKFKISASIHRTAAALESTLQLSHLLPKNFEISLQGQYVSNQIGLPNASIVSLKVSYPAAKAYNLDKVGSMQNLKDWIATPVIYAPRVLAAKDEMLRQYAFGATGAVIPDQSKEVGQLIDPVSTAPYFTPFTDPDLQVSYSVSATQPDGKDYAKLLNLEMKPAANKQATLQSSAPLPPEEILHLTLPTTFLVTITATGIKSGMSKPMIAQSSFHLTLSDSKGTPVWHGELPPAIYGQAYPPQDLNAYVTTEGGPNPDHYAFTLLQNPKWIGLTPDGQSIVGLEIPTPQNAPHSPEPITVSAKSLSSNKSSAHTFNLILQNGVAPLWKPFPAAIYGEPYTQDLRNYVTTPNISPDTYLFVANSLPAWLHLLADGHTLNGTPPGSEVSPVPCVLTATSQTTNSSTQDAFNLPIQPGAPPIWIKNLLPNATYGSTQNYVSDDLITYLQNGSSGHFSFEIETQDVPNVLKLENNTLKATTTIPGNVGTTYHVTVRATNLDTHGVQDQILTLTIQPGAPPVWIKNTLPNADYGSTQNYVSDDLKNYLQNGSSGNFSFQVQTQDVPNLLQLENNTLRATGVIPGNVGATYHITVRAINLDTQGAQDEVLTLTIQPGAPPEWTNTLLPNAIYGSTDTYVSDNLLDHIKNGSSGHFSFAILKQDAPGVLQLDNTFLKATTTIPGNVGSIYHITMRATNLDTQGVQDATLTLTIEKGAPPVWIKTTLPNATYGSTTAYVSDDLTTYIQNGGPNIHFAIRSQDAPGVLQLNGNTLQATKTIPGNVGDTYHITLRATDTNTQNYQDETLVLTIQAGAPPVWIKDTLPNATYGSTQTYVSDHLTTYLLNSSSGHFSFSVESQEVPNLLQLNGDVLHATGTIPGNVGDIYHIKVRATNLDTGGAQDQTLNLAIQAGAPPVWIKDTLPTATYGSTQTYVTDDLVTYLQNGSSGHFSFTIQQQDAEGVLQLSGDKLQATKTIPGNAGDVYHITILATNLDTQGVQSQILNLPIQAGAPPIWIKDILPDATYGSTQNYVSDDLLTYLQNGSSGHFSFTVESQDVSGLLQLSGNTLHSTGVIPGDVGSHYHITLRATNLDTQGVQDQTLTLTIQAGAPPVWTNTLLPNATYGSTDSYVSDDLLNHIENGKTGHFSFEVLQQDAEGVLQLDNTTLKATTTIPGNVGDTYHITVRATNLDTKGVQDAILTLTIEKGAPPVWIKNTLPNATYGSTAAYVSDDLTTYIQNGGPNIQFSIQSQDQPNVLKLSGNTLQATQTIPGDVGALYHVTVRAFNVDTQNYQDETLVLMIQAGAPPIWISDTLTPATNQGVTNYVSDPLKNYLQNGSAGNFSFTIESQDSSPGWFTLTADGRLAAAKIPDDAPTQYSVKIIAKDLSTQGQTEPHKLTLTINRPNPPEWIKDLNGQIKFDTTTIDSIDQIWLNKFIVPGTEGPNLSFKFTNGKQENGNWKILNSGDQWYLARNPLSPTTIDAADVDQLVGVGLIAQNSGGESPPAQMNVQVKPDPALTYNYTGTYISNCVGTRVKLAAVDPVDGAIQCTLPFQSGSIQAKTPQAFTVVNDHNLILDAASGSPNFVNYNSIHAATPTVNFYSPSIDYYPSSNLPWYLNAGSRANGNIPNNVSYLPFIDVNQVQIKNTITPYNFAEYETGYKCLSRHTSLLKLTVLKNNTSPYSMQYPALNNLPEDTSQLSYKACTGVVNTSEDPCNNKVDLSFAGGTTGKNVVADSNGQITIVASTVCLDKGVYPLNNNPVQVVFSK